MPTKKLTQKPNTINKAASTARQTIKKVAPKTENGKSDVVVTQTTASSVVEPAAQPISFHASHAEAAAAAENENKTFATEIQPKPSVLDVARKAWAAVKGATDPEFDACVPTHRDKFLSHCESVLKGNSPQAGETHLARFEQKCAELRDK